MTETSHPIHLPRRLKIQQQHTSDFAEALYCSFAAHEHAPGLQTVRTSRTEYARDAYKKIITIAYTE